MAEEIRSIVDLSEAGQLLDSGLLVLYQGGETVKMTGLTLKRYASMDVASVTLTMGAAGSQASANYNPTSKILSLTIPSPSNATITATHYSASSSGTTTPSSGWKTSIPSMSGGQYLWTRLTWSTGQYSYVVARQGVDGTGAVTSFNGRSGAVVPAAGDYGINDITGLSERLGDIDTVVAQINSLVGG